MISRVLNVRSRVRSYDVLLVSSLAQAIKDRRVDGSFLIIDADLPRRHSIIRLFPKERVIHFKANEQSKTLEGCSGLIEQLIQKGIRKNTTIYAVGGGVVEDAAAFVSTVLFRGVEWFFCPTTLLAQADSCIGSKSSINFGAYKNLLGSFYPPSQVLIDMSFLETLPSNEIRSGIGEILHYYLVAGKTQLAKRMMAQYISLIRNPQGMKPFILASLKIKKAVIERDEFDQGERNLFNYGHTFGHAIESLSQYQINHGQAVTMGMDMANYISYSYGYINHKTYQLLRSILEVNLPDFRLTSRQWDQYRKALSKDKKNVGSTLGCILTRGPGEMFKTQIVFNEKLKESIMSYFSRG